jgi:DNA-binding transcriptional ArsR family regulator
MSRTSAKKQRDTQLDAVFAALADPTRRYILRRLLAGPASVGELGQPLAMSPPAVSKHLRILEQAGLLRREREGRVHRLSLDAAPLRTVNDFIEQYRAFWEDKLEQLARYLESDEDQ